MMKQRQLPFWIHFIQLMHWIYSKNFLTLTYKDKPWRMSHSYVFDWLLAKLLINKLRQISGFAWYWLDRLKPRGKTRGHRDAETITKDTVHLTGGVFIVHVWIDSIPKRKQIKLVSLLRFYGCLCFVECSAIDVSQWICFVEIHGPRVLTRYCLCHHCFSFLSSNELELKDCKFHMSPTIELKDYLW